MSTNLGTFLGSVGDRSWLPTAPHPQIGMTRTPVSSAVQGTFQSGHTWTATTGGAGTNVNNTASPPIGSQYATIQTQGLGTGTPVRLTASGMTVDLTGKTLWLLMRVTGVANLDNVQVYAGTSGFASYWLFQLDRYTDTRAGAYWREGEWAWMPFSFENVSSTVGSPVKSAVTDMRVTVIDHGGVVTADIAAFATSPNASTFAWPNGVVSFTCDDGWVSQYTAARPALDKYLYPATAYTIADVIDGTSSLGGEGSMSLAQLQSLQAANRWEIAAHASTLANHDAMFTTLSVAQLNAEFSAIKKWLHDKGFGGGDHLAFPQGAYNDTVMERVQHYFTSARAINSFARESYPAGDRHRFRAVGLNNGITLATAKGYVDSAKASGAWLTIVVHKLGATADSLTWVTSDFQALVDYIAASSVPVRTVGQVLASRNEEAIRANGASIAANTASIAATSSSFAAYAKTAQLRWNARRQANYERDNALPFTVYVDSVKGSDANTGASPAQAYATLGKLTTATIAAGARIGLARGSTFTGNFTVPTATGTLSPTNRIVFGAYGVGAAPKISAGTFTIAQPYIDVQDLRFTGASAGRGLFIFNATAGVMIDNRVKRCEIDSCTQSGGLIMGTIGGLVEDCYVHDNWNQVEYPSGDGFGMLFTTSTDSTEIRYNVFRGNYKGIGTASTHRNLFIHHNIVDKQRVNGIDMGAGGVVGAPPKIVNNFVWHRPTTPNGHGIDTQASTTGHFSRNNIVYSDYTGAAGNVELYCVDSTTYTDGDYDYNLGYMTPACTATYGKLGSTTYATLALYQAAMNATSYAGKEAHSLSVDPMIADLTNLLFMPLPGSPAIDAGITVGGVTDLAGYLGAAPDLGAFEVG